MDIKIPEQWTKNTYEQFISELVGVKEEKYKQFNSKIVFTDYLMLGIRIPILKKIATQIYKSDYQQFLKIVDNRYYEIILIEGLIISYIEEKEEFISYLEPFMLHIDNWAITDTIIYSKMKVVNKNKNFFFEKAKQYITDSHEYVVRVGILLLMTFYIEEEHIDEVFGLLDNISREEYYINMAIAWLISYAFIQFKSKTIQYLQNNKLDKFTQNKAISKIRDSFRVSKEEKELIVQYKK